MACQPPISMSQRSLSFMRPAMRGGWLVSMGELRKGEVAGEGVGW
jgi:hypothetical protein